MPAPAVSLATGRLYSYYDGATWTKASDVDIDHMVPLKEAWESCARLWSVTNRTRYANDLGFYATLIAVTATSTRQRATGTQRCGCRHAPLHGAPTPSNGCR